MLNDALLQSSSEPSVHILVPSYDLYGMQFNTCDQRPASRIYIGENMIDIQGLDWIIGYSIQLG